MLKFFRKIRQNLLSEGKTGKYLKYAIGEIILVVIGILIALQINNWNENRKLQNIEHNYLKLLLEDLDEESINLNNAISNSEELITRYEEYEEKANNSNMGLLEITSSLSKVDPAVVTPIFKIDVMETLISTGDIKLIPTEIRKKIIELNNAQEYIRQITKRNGTIHAEQIYELGKIGWSKAVGRLIKNPATNIAFTDERIIQIIFAVESVYYMKYENEKFYIAKYEGMLSDIIGLKKEIRLELNQK